MLEKSENRAGCEFRYVSLLPPSRYDRRTTYRMRITSSSASSCASPIAAYSCSSSARCQQSHIDPDQYFGPPPCYGLSLFSPAQEKSDVAWHSARKLEDAGSQPETMRPQIPFPPDTHVGCFAAQCCRSIGVLPRTPFPRFLPLGVPGASDRASFRPKRDGQSAVPPRDAVAPRQHGDRPPDAGFFTRVIRHKLPKICRHRSGSSGSSPAGPDLLDPGYGRYAAQASRWRPSGRRCRLATSCPPRAL